MTSTEIAEAAQLYPDVCAYCLVVHASANVHENFEDDKGFSVFDLSLYADTATEPLNWDTITRETRFQDADAYLLTVAADYLRNGDVECYCGDKS